MYLTYALKYSIFSKPFWIALKTVNYGFGGTSFDHDHDIYNQRQYGQEDWGAVWVVFIGFMWVLRWNQIYKHCPLPLLVSTRILLHKNHGHHIHHSLTPHHTFKTPQFMLVLSTNKSTVINWNTSEETGRRHRKLLSCRSTNKHESQCIHSQFIFFNNF